MIEEIKQQAQNNVETLQEDINELCRNSWGALDIPDITEKTVQRSLNELCVGIIEKVCGLVSKEESTTILCEQISAVQNMTGKQLSDFLTTRFKALESDNQMPDLRRSVSNILGDLDNELDRDLEDEMNDAPSVENVDAEESKRA